MKILSIIKYTFALIGLGMLAGAFFWYTHTSSFLEKAIETDGTVVDLVVSRSSDSRTYAPVITFADQSGKQIRFISSNSSNPPSYTKGENVEVLYLPDNPQNARINGFFSLWGGTIIVGGIGAIFFLIGGGIILYFRIKERNKDYLKKNGIPIETDFQRVELNRSLTVNGRNPYRIVTQWQNPSTSAIHVFESDNLWFDPSDYINQKRITVLIEKGNPEKYYVDLSFLPEIAE